MSIGGVCILGCTFAEVNDVSSAGPAYGVGEFDGICSVGCDYNFVDGILSDSFAEFVRICRVRLIGLCILPRFWRCWTPSQINAKTPCGSPHVLGRAQHTNLAKTSSMADLMQ